MIWPSGNNRASIGQAQSGAIGKLVQSGNNFENRFNRATGQSGKFNRRSSEALSNFEAIGKRGQSGFATCANVAWHPSPMQLNYFKCNREVDAIWFCRANGKLHQSGFCHQSGNRLNCANDGNRENQPIRLWKLNTNGSHRDVSPIWMDPFPIRIWNQLG